MKEIRNKEVIIGLAVILILAVIALFLLIRKERGQENLQPQTFQSAGSLQAQEQIEEEAVPEEVEEAETANRNSLLRPHGEGASANSSQTVSGNGLTVSENSVKVKANNTDPSIHLYSVLGEEKYRSFSLVERKKEDNQLAELFGYWDAYQMDAVNDLINLDRIRAISAQLDGTQKYYYYGQVDQLGRPNGRGLAVYGEDTYYCGDWKEGLRSGKGMWLQLVRYDADNQNMNLGLTLHMYNGNWSKDLPNGQGQEHFQYDYGILNEEHNRTVLNVIGGFKDGYYDGEMYVMTTNNFGVTYDWRGVCQKGVWDIQLPGSVTDGVWRSYEPDEKGDYEYYFMFPEDNRNQGVYGLKK